MKVTWIKKVPIIVIKKNTIINSKSLSLVLHGTLNCVEEGINYLNFLFCYRGERRGL